MDYYTIADNQYVVRCSIDLQDFVELRNYLKDQSIVEGLSISAATADSMPDFSKVVDQVTHAVITITLVRATASLGKDIIKETIMHLIKRWIDNHNTRHNAEIEAGKTEPIIYNSFGQTISLKKDKS